MRSISSLALVLVLSMAAAGCAQQRTAYNGNPSAPSGVDGVVYGATPSFVTGSISEQTPPPRGLIYAQITPAPVPAPSAADVRSEPTEPSPWPRGLIYGQSTPEPAPPPGTSYGWGGSDSADIAPPPRGLIFAQSAPPRAPAPSMSNGWGGSDSAGIAPPPRGLIYAQSAPTPSVDLAPPPAVPPPSADMVGARPAPELYAYAPAAAPAPAMGHYTLDSGDRLRVVVFGQEGLTNSYLVSASGQIDMPLIGSVMARGATSDQLAGRIAAKLRDGYIREPHVAVEIEAYRPFFILGEVTQPGQYPYVANMTAETAIAIAGGFTPRAFRRNIIVTRTANGVATRMTVPLNFPLRPGDTLNVQERWF